MTKPLDYYDSLVPSVPFNRCITKCVVQTARSGNLPKRIQENIEELKSLNPNWQFQLFDDGMVEEFILNEYGDTILGYFKRIDCQYGAAKADFFRYLYIYRFGGVYLDVKSSFSKSLDESLLPQDCFVTSHWDNQDGLHKGFGLNYQQLSHIPGGEYLQCFLISSAGHPYLRSVIINMLKRMDDYNVLIDRVGHDAVFFTTGPNMYSLAVQNAMENENDCSLHRVVDVFSEFGYVYSIFEKETQDVEAHAKVFKSHYRNAWHPLILNKESKLRDSLAYSICWLYSKYLQVVTFLRRC